MPTPLFARRYSLNEAAFDDISSPAALYYLGLLLTDGSIYLPRGGRGVPVVKLSLVERDRAHVETFRDFLGYGGRVYAETALAPRSGKEVRVATLVVASRKLGERLMACGVTPRKSHTVRALVGADTAHLWRGALDGDGCISFATPRLRYHPRIIMGSASRGFMEQYSAFVRAAVPGAVARVREAKDGFWEVTVSARFASALARTLYQDASPALPRKLEAAQRAMAWQPVRQRHGGWGWVTADLLLSCLAVHGNWRAAGLSLGIPSGTITKVKRDLGL